MGDIADMIINGSMCACGAFLEDLAEPGHPRFCSPQCERDYGPSASPHHQSVNRAKPWGCSGCNKTFKTEAAAGEHIKAKHRMPTPVFLGEK